MESFITNYNGDHGVGNTAANKGECVGLVMVWLASIGAPHIWGNACDLPANADRNAYTITPYTPGYVPNVGDAVSWPAGWGGSSVGHTAIVAPGTTAKKLVVFEQNDRIDNHNGVADEDGRCRLTTFDYSGNPTFIHPKILANQGDEMIPDENHLQALFRAFRGRPAGPDEVKKYVGTNYSGMVEALDQGDERRGVADALAAYPDAKGWKDRATAPGAVITQQAVLDDLNAWKSKGLDLEKQAQAQQTTIDTLNRQAEADDAAITSLQGQLKAAEDALEAAGHAPAPETPNPSGLDNYSLGELLTAAFKKTFKIK